MPQGLDTDTQVFFYEQEFYPFSNFSAFALFWKGRLFPTSEHTYQWEKFDYVGVGELAGWAPRSPLRVKTSIEVSRSAHEAYKIAESHAAVRRTDWNEVRVDIMRSILRAKTHQHEYVARKLEETGDREIIENSWRDAFWGWGPNRDGQNMLGKLWMEIRAERRGKGV